MDGEPSCIWKTFTPFWISIRSKRWRSIWQSKSLHFSGWRKTLTVCCAAAQKDITKQTSHVRRRLSCDFIFFLQKFWRNESFKRGEIDPPWFFVPYRLARTVSQRRQQQQHHNTIFKVNWREAENLEPLRRKSMLTAWSGGRLGKKRGADMKNIHFRYL